MKPVRVVMLSLSMVLLCGLFSAARQSATTAANATVPPLIPFSSVATDEGGSSLSGVVNLTFSLYAAQQGGAPLWTETQNNIQLDATGHYSVQLGITQLNGVPTTLFTTGEARWLGVRIAEQVEQPRVLLLSVPYALKAGDAATIGGLPPSAFVLAAPPSSSPAVTPLDAGATLQSSAPPPTGGPVTGTGTLNFLPLWDSTSDIISSVVFQSATSPFKIGINTTTPATTLDVKGSGTIRGTLSLPATGTATATKSANSQPMTLAASAFNTTSGKATAETFQLQAEPVGNDTPTNSATLNLLFGSGTTKPAETGLNIASTGVITFNAAQTFPNTITGITTAPGSGLIGGATSGTPSLSLLNNCNTNQVLQWNGTAWACATVSGGGGSGTVTSVATGLGLFGGPITTSGTLTIDTTVVPQLAAATNTFTGTVNANVVNATTGFDIAGVPFDSGSPFTGSGLGNSYLGFAGNTKTTGQGNVGAGWAALLANTTGTYNTAVGVSSLFTNTTGVQNTAVGYDALFANVGGSTAPLGSNNTAIGFGAAYMNSTGYNNTAIGYEALYDNIGGLGNTAIGAGSLFNNTTTGNFNTAIGYQAGPTTNLTNSTAIGYQALVSESNALVLGGTGANAVKVGIGTSAPAYTLDAAGTIRSSTGGFMFPDGTTQTTAATGGGGSITGVTAGTGLTGGGTSGNVTLSINTAVIPELSSANAFSGTITAGTSSSSSFGVLGESNAASGQNYGVGGLAQSPSGYGVWGLNTASGGIGVYGFDSAGTGVSGSGGTGVSGTGVTYGVNGTATGAGSSGVYGTAPQYGVQGLATGNGSGVFGAGADGVYGIGTINGVYGTGSNGVNGAGTVFGVVGNATAASSTGVYGSAPQYGVQGFATGSGSTVGVTGVGAIGLQGSGTADGVYGTATGGGSTVGVYGTGPIGVYGNGATNGGTGIEGWGGEGSEGDASGGAGGVFVGAEGNEGGVGATFQGGSAFSEGSAGGDGMSAWPGYSGNTAAYAGYFSGNIDVTGSTEDSSYELKIDHPLDPGNKYLYHSSVESSEMMNIYTGNVTTDGQGLATVQLPDWFEAVNTDFRYQLTVMGQFAQAIVDSKVASHRFSIRTDKPNVEVSWQITGVRQDAYAKAHPLVVEPAKDARERGHYIHPELYGAPVEQSVEWARHPEIMKRMQETRARQLAAAQSQTSTIRAETLPLAVPPTPKPMPQRLPTPRVAPVRPAAGAKPTVRAELQPSPPQPR
jgi:hypothetical protein